MKEKENIQEQLKANLCHGEESLPQEVWANIQKEIGEKKKKRFIFFILLMGIMVAGASVLFLLVNPKVNGAGAENCVVNFSELKGIFKLKDGHELALINNDEDDLINRVDIAPFSSNVEVLTNELRSNSLDDKERERSTPLVKNTSSKKKSRNSELLNSDKVNSFLNSKEPFEKDDKETNDSRKAKDKIDVLSIKQDGGVVIDALKESETKEKSTYRDKNDLLLLYDYEIPNSIIDTIVGAEFIEQKLLRNKFSLNALFGTGVYRLQNDQFDAGQLGGV